MGRPACCRPARQTTYLISRHCLPDNANVRLINATTWKRWYLIVTRLLAPLCAALALLFFYDVVATPTETDTARVVGKVQETRRAAPVFIIEATGRYSYREDV